jgi:hypothetical protein
VDPPCGSQRSLTVQQAVPSLSVHLTLVDEKDRVDVISWVITASGLEAITAAHLRDAQGDRLLYDFTAQSPPVDGVTVAGNRDYTNEGGIDALFTLVRTGATYVEVHTGSAAPAIRVDLTSIQFKDWSDYYCS